MDSSEVTSVFDDDVLDQLHSDLYTRDWIQYGSIEVNTCPEHGSVPTPGCSQCNNDPKLEETRLTIVYVAADSVTKDGNYTVPPRYNELRAAGNELSPVQFMPLKPECYYTLAPYLAAKTGSVSRGEMLMNVCTATTKTPCIKIPWCIIGRYRGTTPDEYASISKVDQEWVLFLPRTALVDIFALMEDHDMYPTPDLHDGRSYCSSRLRVAGTVTSRIMSSTDWTTGEELDSIRRYLNCDAVITATFTVTVHVTPPLVSRGKHSRYRKLVLWIHSIH